MFYTGTLNKQSGIEVHFRVHQERSIGNTEELFRGF